MVAVVIVTHGNLSQSLLEAAHLIVGEIPSSKAVALQPEDGPETAGAKVEAAMEAVDEGDGVLLLVDLPGGTPCTICLRCLEQHKAEVISGVNLSMLVKVPFMRTDKHLSLPELAEALAAQGSRAIRVVTGAGCEGI